MTAEKFCLLASASFLMNGLLTGVWKYVGMMRSPEGVAPAYVDIAHRTSLMYAFACLVLRELVPTSPVGPTATLWVVAIPIIYFASAVALYMLHGWLKDTDNQLRQPHRLGSGQLPRFMIQGYMVTLIVREIGGVGILVYGLFASTFIA